MVDMFFQKMHEQGEHAEGVRQRREALQDSRSGMQAGKLADNRSTQLAQKPNNTGLPDNLKSGIESLSGMSMDNIKVHYNSFKPAQLNAHAYAQGTDIHVAPGQEKHLPHEAWHVVQQAQGRVKPTMQMKGGVPVNDNKGLEREADLMGARAAAHRVVAGNLESVSVRSTALQRMVNGKQVKELSEDDYPESVDHIYSQVGKGNSETMTIDRGGAKQNRRESLRGYPTMSGQDRDEWPMAMFSQGGKGAHIEYIDPSDNRGAGSSIGGVLRGFADGTKVVFHALLSGGTKVIQL